MRKILKHQTSFLTKLAFAASYGYGLHPYLAILIEIISCIQILYLILTASFSDSNEKNLLIVPEVQNLFSFLGLYDLSSNFETEISTELIWIVISVGLCAYTVLIIVMAVLCRKEINLNKGIAAVCTVLTTLHSKVLFCPIYYFYVNSILNQERCIMINHSANMCGTVVKGFTLAFTAINGLLALMKEILCYQSYKNRNAFATKNNLHALIQLVHKIIVIPILVLVNDSMIPTSILNFFFTLPSLALLLIKLPYYNIKLLRTTVCLSTISTTLSFVLFWKIFINSHFRIFELLIALVIPVFIKIVKSRLNTALEKILSLRATSPEHLMHLYTLVEDYIFHSGEVDMNTNSRYETLFKFGLLQVTGLDIHAMQNVSEIKNFKDKINMLVLRELLNCYKANPKSRALLLYITQFYMQKIKNASQAVVYIQKIQNMPLSIPIQNTLVKIKEKLKSTLFIAYSQKDPSLEFINYFKYREISNTLKETIVTEVQLHIDFWQIISKDKVEVRKIIDISGRVDILATKVKRMWKIHEKDFIKNFPVPLILFRVYLFLIKGVPNIAESYMDTTIGQNNKVIKSMEKWFSQEKASIVGSIQKGTLGIVLDASNSVQNLFNIKKDDLIGRKVNILMPNMIQDKHDFLIERYNEKPEYTIDIKNDVYCKTVDGQFFDAKFELKVYPYIDKGIGLIGMLTKKHECELMFFLDVDGNIADCSNELLNDFRANFTLSKHINIEEIAPEFRKINEAFNVINIPKSRGLTGPAQVTNSREDSQTPKEQRKAVRLNQIFTFPEKETIPDSAARLISTRQNETQKTDTFTPQTTERGPLRLPLEEIIGSQEEHEMVLPQSKSIAALFLTHLSSKHSQPVLRDQVKKEFLNLNEAERICEEVSKEKKISFFTQDILDGSLVKLTYFAKVDILWFENKFYKVVKVRKPTNKEMTMEVKTPRWLSGSKQETQLAFGARSPGSSLFENRLQMDKTPKIISKSSYFMSIQDHEEGEGKDEYLSVDAIQDHEEKNLNTIQKKKIKASKRRENRRVEKALYDLFRKGKESTFTKVYILAFYFAMLLMITLATVTFVNTRSSFQQIELVAKLVDANTDRFIALVKVWAMTNAIYTFLFQNKPLPSFLEYTPLILEQANIIKTRNRDLSLMLPEINSEDVIAAFYKKNVHLWEPFSVNQTRTEALDVFSATNIVMDKLLLFIDTKRYLLLNDPNLAIFALNNTANELSNSYNVGISAALLVRANIYASNLTLIFVLLSIEVAAMSIIFLSLIGLAFKIRKTHMRLFTVLSTISSRTFETRSKELIQFRNCLQESIESRKFMNQLNSFTEEKSKARNQAQFKDFKLKDKSKFSFFSTRLRSFGLLVIAFILFAGILTLQTISTRHSAYSIAILKKINAGATQVKIMGFQAQMLQGNIIYWMNFYDRAPVTIYNLPPELILNYNLELLADANQQLLSIFSGEDDFYSPEIDEILNYNVCPFVPSIIDMCRVATKGEILGMFGVNLQFYELVTTYAELFRGNMTIENANSTVYAYLMKARPYVATSDRAYTYMRASLLQSLFQTIEDENETNKPLFIAICFVCVIVTLLVRVIVLESLKKFDKSKYKILMLVPQETLLANKAMVLYLRNEFSKELKSIL